MKIRFLMGLAVTSLAWGTASAQTTESPALPDPASIQLPDVTAGMPERDSSGEAKYFYFHRAGISIERAATDIAECIGYGSPPIPPVRLAAFVLLDETVPQGGPLPIPMYGMVGAVIGAIITPSLNRRNMMSGMRICMGYKNYKRYPTTKEAYLALYEGDDARLSVLMLAKLASGPTPQAESLAP